MNRFDESDEARNLPLPAGDARAQTDPVLFVSDTEMYRRLGVGPRTGRIAVLALERSGFPPKLPLWGNRRYWPAVQAFLDRHYGASPYNRFRHQSNDAHEIQGQPRKPRLAATTARLLGGTRDDSGNSE